MERPSSWCPEPTARQQINGAGITTARTPANAPLRARTQQDHADPMRGYSALRYPTPYPEDTWDTRIS